MVLFPGCKMKPLGSKRDGDSSPVISREGGIGRWLMSPLCCLGTCTFSVLPPPAVIDGSGRVSGFSIQVSKINACCRVTCFLALLRHSCLIMVLLAFKHEYFVKGRFSSWVTAKLCSFRAGTHPTHQHAHTDEHTHTDVHI